MARTVSMPPLHLLTFSPQYYYAMPTGAALPKVYLMQRQHHKLLLLLLLLLYYYYYYYYYYLRPTTTTTTPTPATASNYSYNNYNPRLRTRHSELQSRIRSH